MKYLKRDRGQAVVEYLLIFGFMALLALNMAKALGGFMGESVGSLAYTLSQNLSVGVCKRFCFYDGFKNGPTPR